MAIGAGAAAAIAAGATIASAGGQMYANAKLNKRAERYNRDMAQIQRNWALEDWERQNKYNSPAAQMERYKEAGLNPNLIYGQSNEGATVRSTDIKGMDYKGTDIGTPIARLGETFQNYYSLKMQQQQVRNMEQEFKLKQQDELIKQAQLGNIVAQTAATLTGTRNTEFDLQFKEELKETNMDLVRQSLGRSIAETEVMLRRDEREAAANASNLWEAAQRVINMRVQNSLSSVQGQKLRAEIEQLKKTGKISDLEAEFRKLDLNLRKQGVQPNDPAWMRILTQQLSTWLPSFRSSTPDSLKRGNTTPQMPSGVIR